MTQNQLEVLAILRKRGADFTAAATERAWLAGETYYLDKRNSARRGIVRRFELGNRYDKVFAWCSGCSHGSPNDANPDLRWLYLSYDPKPVWECVKCGMDNSERRLRLLTPLERKSYGID